LTLFSTAYELNLFWNIEKCKGVHNSPMWMWILILYLVEMDNHIIVPLFHMQNRKEYSSFRIWEILSKK
jgi:hypothetical protein